MDNEENREEKRIERDQHEFIKKHKDADFFVVDPKTNNVSRAVYESLFGKRCKSVDDPEPDQWIDMNEE